MSSRAETWLAAVRRGVALACCALLCGCIGFGDSVYHVGTTDIDVRINRPDIRAVRLACADFYGHPDVFIGLVNGQQPAGKPIQDAVLRSGAASFHCDEQLRIIGVPIFLVPMPQPSDADDRFIFLMLEGDSRVYQVNVHGDKVRVRAGDARVVPSSESVAFDLKRHQSKEGMAEFRTTFERHRHIYESAQWKEAPTARASVVTRGAAKEAMRILVQIGDE